MNLNNKNELWKIEKLRNRATIPKNLININQLQFRLTLIL